MSECLHSEAIVFERPGQVGLRSVDINRPTLDEVVVRVEGSGISTGTEKLLWRGTMPAFPGLAYPLVPGYEAVGTVIDTGESGNDLLGQRVFVPGASCYQGDVRGLFGASASTLVVSQARITPIGSLPTEEGILLALAATAMHALTQPLRQATKRQHIALSELGECCPELIVGHGVLGRLIARLALAVGAEAPMVWELDEQRQSGARGYEVVSPQDDDVKGRQRIVDVSGAGGDHFDKLISRLGKGGELVLAGFYPEAVSFNFPQAFMREARLCIAAEWTPDDLALVLSLLEARALSLDELVTHSQPVANAESAYRQAFDDASCLKMMLNWSAG